MSKSKRKSKQKNKNPNLKLEENLEEGADLLATENRAHNIKKEALGPNTRR